MVYLAPAVRAKLLALSLLLQVHSEPTTQYRRYAVRPINRMRSAFGSHALLNRHLRELDPAEYFSTFRMVPELFDNLLARVEPFIRHKKTCSAPVSPRERLELTLELLATGNSQKYMAKQYRLGRSTVNSIYYETCGAIWQALSPEFVKFPDREKFKEIAGDFWNKWNFPLCLGAIDGKLVKMSAPKNTGSAFYDYKGNFSINLMACVDAKYRFTMIDVGAAGRLGDSRTFSDSAFGRAIIDMTLDVPDPSVLPGTADVLEHMFIADDAFTISQNLMKPFPMAQLPGYPDRRIFNYRLSRARRVVENAFGILAARFRVLRNQVEVTPDNAITIVKACVALHNFLATMDDLAPTGCRYAPPAFVDSEDASGNVRPGGWRRFGALDGMPRMNTTSERLKEAYAIRERLVGYFLSSAGRVRWQEQAALST